MNAKMKAKLFAWFAVFTLLAGSVYAFGAITGYTSSPYEDRSEDLDIVIDKTQTTSLSISDIPGTFKLISVKLTGTFKGNGFVKVALVDKKGEEYLVLDYDRKKDSFFFSKITGLFTAVGRTLTGEAALGDVEKQEETIREIAFNQKCVNSCPLPIEGFDNDNIILKFDIEGGVLEVDRIDYQFVELEEEQKKPFISYLTGFATSFFN